MTTEPIDTYFAKLCYAETASAVDAVFADIRKEKPTQRKAILAGIEEKFETLFRQNYNPHEAADIRMEIQMMEMMRDNPLAKVLGIVPDNAETEDLMADMKAMSQIFLNLKKARGDSAGPLVQIFSTEAAKLSDEEYGTALGQMKLTANFFEAVEKAPVKPPAKPAANPFRAFKQ